MDNNNNKKVVDETTVKEKETVEKIEDTVEEVKNEVKETSSKKGIFALLAVIALIAIVGFFILKNSNTGTKIDNNGATVSDLTSIGKVSSKDVTFETISNQYIKVANAGIIENGSGKVNLVLKNFSANTSDEENGKISFNFNDDIKYSAKTELKNKKISVEFNNDISVGADKTENTPKIDIKNLPVKFKVLMNEARIYLNVDTDLKKVLAYSPDPQASTMAEMMVGPYLGRDFFIKTSDISGQDEGLKDELEKMFSVEEMKKQFDMFNKYNKQYQAFSLKSTGKTDKINGVKATEFSVKLGETKNIIKFFQAVMNDESVVSKYTQEQKEMLKKNMKEMTEDVDKFFANKKKADAVEKIVNDNIDYQYNIWISENGLPVKVDMKVEIKNGAKLINDIQEISVVDKEEKVVASGEFKLNINFVEIINYNQKIDIVYPEDKDAVDLIEMVGGFFGTSMPAENNLDKTAIPVSGVPS